MKIPSAYSLCFTPTCPRKTTCLRYVAGQHIPSKVTSGSAIYPTALSSDGTCPYYREYVKVKLAYGFQKIFAVVRKKDVEPLRNRLKQYLGGHGTYYRYNRGEKLLTPVQQDAILTICQEFGYTETLTFDNYLTDYDFSE